MSRRFLVLLPLGALVIALFTVRLPYFSQGPGPAEDVQPLIRVAGHQKFASAGHFILTSVAFAVLSRVAGYPRAHGRGVLVESVLGSDCPASGKLFPGDRLQALNGRPILSERDFRRRVDRMPPGATLRLQGTAGGEPFTLSLVRRRCDNSKRPLIGIASVPTFPFGISISSGDIGGPSAGLMWALGLYDLLTPGDLTGGRTIAGTGTISPDGRVGPIGGVQDKVAGAKAAGASLFFVPAGGNYRQAGTVAGRLNLVPVRSLTQALRYLRRR
jgi:PDZ domain-containing protein